MNNGNLDVEKSDKKWIQFAKKLTRLLLLTAFILQIICIFVTTVLGTDLLSIDEFPKGSYTTALEFLKDNFEFEYLTARISFLQGLLNWLAAIALEHIIPQGNETEARRKLDLLIFYSLSSVIIMMISFYNVHQTFYDNYFGMICQYAHIIMKRYVFHWPPRIMNVVAMPFFLLSAVYGYQVLFHDVMMSGKEKTIKGKRK